MQNNIVHKYMQLIPWRSKKVRSYIYLNLKFQDYSIFLRLLSFDIASLTCYASKRLLFKAL